MVQVLISVLNVVIFAALFGCLSGWGFGVARWRRGEALLAPERRRKPRHGFAEVIMLVGLWLVLTVIGIGVAEQAHWVEPVTASEPSASGEGAAETPIQLDPDFAIRFTIEGLAKLAAIGLLLVWLRTIQTAAAERLGVVPRWGDFRTGLVAAAMLIPPVMLVQQLLNLLTPYVHPVKDLIEARPTPLLGTLFALNTVLIAPLAEEFFFRGVLQGWFQRLAGRPRGRGDAEQAAAMAAPSDPLDGMALLPEDAGPQGAAVAAGPGLEGSDPEVAEEAAGEASDWWEAEEIAAQPYWPMVVTSLLFSLVHWGQGAAPVSLFLLALGLSYLTRQTGRLWPAITVHFCLNAVATAAMFLAAGSPADPPPLGP